jgi:hypothetical protein
VDVSISYEDALRLVAAVGGVGVAVSAVEDLVRARVYADDSLLSWRVSRLRQPWSTTGARAAVLDSLLAYPAVRRVLWCRAGAAVLTVATALAGWRAPLLWLAVALTYVLLFLRNAEGHDGAEQMYLLVFTALTIAGLAPAAGPVGHYCLLFVAVQASLAYAIAGIHKLRARAWRDGTALTGILGTNSYGSGWSYRLLRRRPVLSRTLCWAVILLECGFPVVFLVDTPVALVILAVALLFHLANAVVMGLNGFLLAFACTYPAVLYTAQSIGGNHP